MNIVSDIIAESSTAIPALFGRREDLQNVAEILAQNRSTRLAILGPSGVGKTKFSEMILSGIRTSSGEGNTPLPIITCSLSAKMHTTENHLLYEIYQQLEAQANLRGEHVKAALKQALNGLSTGAKELTCALLIQFLKTKFEDAESYIEILEEQFSSTAEGASADFFNTFSADKNTNRREAIRAYFNFLAAAGVGFVIAVDDAQAFSSDNFNALKFLTDNATLPNNCALLLMAQTESPDGHNIKTNFLNLNFRIEGGQEYLLEPLSISAIKEWGLNEQSRNVSNEEASAIRACSAGLPYWVNQYWKGMAPDAITQQRNHQGQPSAQRILSSFNPEEQKLCRLMAILPEGSLIDTEILIRVASNSGISEPRKSLENLATHSVKRQGNFVSLSHDILRNVLLTYTEDDEKEAFYSEWQNECRNLLSSGHTTGHNVMPVVEALLESPQYLPTEVSFLPILGYADSNGLGEVRERLLDYTNDDGFLRDMASIQQNDLSAASLKIEQGKYIEAEKRLKKIEAAERLPSDLKVKSLLLSLKLKLRMNQYSEFFELHSVIQEAYGDDIETRVESLCRLNTVFRDLNDIPKLSETIFEIEELSFLDLAQPFESRLNRCLARSLAKVGESERAKEVAKSALSLAENDDDANLLMTSLLAEAEVSRYSKDHLVAVDLYSKAINLVPITGDWDCELWCLLGRANSYGCLGMVMEMDTDLERLKSMVSGLDRTHPLETAHAKLISIFFERPIFTDISKESVLGEYRDLGVNWPQLNWSALGSRPILPL
jgi:tetratricopeptide (TPR) repeat protein